MPSKLMMSKSGINDAFFVHRPNRASLLVHFPGFCIFTESGRKT